ncbi:MAG: hypothetical protein Q9182_004670 [Xanthomendoza sp. 2 TL-2023]
MAQSSNDYIFLGRGDNRPGKDYESNVDAPLTSEQTESDAEGMLDILRIVPLNTEALKAFDGVAKRSKNGKLDPLHDQYLHITGERSLGYDKENVRGSSGETTDEDPEPTMGLGGYYRVSFALPSVSKGPKWVMGRGSGKKFGPNRNVDILLVDPESKGLASLAAAHLYLEIHPHSGAWIIKAGASVKVEGESYSAKQAAVLRQSWGRP